jgi:hypothetical protein
MTAATVMTATTAGTAMTVAATAANPESRALRGFFFAQSRGQV